MSELHHPHVLGLLGVTTGGALQLGLPLLVLPFMEHGDLQSYLRRFRFEKKEEQVIEQNIDCGRYMYEKGRYENQTSCCTEKHVVIVYIYI